LLEVGVVAVVRLEVAVAVREVIALLLELRVVAPLPRPF
jgi:hypothetical protein